MRPLPALFVPIVLSMGITALFDALPTPAKPPVIPDELRAAFWKSRSLVQEAQSELDRASALNAKAVGDMQKFCGDGYQVQFDAEKNPTCVAVIPVENKKPEVKKP